VNGTRWKRPTELAALQGARLVRAAAVLQSTQLWPTDLAFRQGAAKWSMLHAKTIPPAGGDTEYSDTRAAYDALPDAMKRRLEGLIAEHSLWHSTAKRGGYVPTEKERRSNPPARHKLVRRHPCSWRNALYIASYASHIVGMPVEDGQALLAELIEFATQPQFVYRHKWQVGDLVIWATAVPCTAPHRSRLRTTCATCAARRLSSEPRTRLPSSRHARDKPGHDAE
jgi:alpha-ketoglutarate-dependent 2,4-dichlorophenoxyacetate dioxygenase